MWIARDFVLRFFFARPLTTIDQSPVREGDNNSRRVSDVEDDPVGFQVPSHFVGETFERKT